jgi:hypothetical protein
MISLVKRTKEENMKCHLHKIICRQGLTISRKKGRRHFLSHLQNEEKKKTKE